MTGFYMKLNTELKWVNVLGGMYLFKVNNGNTRTN